VFGNLPAYTRVVSPVGLVTRLLPRIPWISDGINVSWENVYERQPLPRLSFSDTAHSPSLGVFAASNSDIVHVRSLFPSKTPQLLVADATAVKVGLVSKGSPLCSTCQSRVSFRAVWHFPRILRVSKPLRKSRMAQVLLLLNTMSGEGTEGSQGQASPRATTSSSGNRQSIVSLGISPSGTEMERGALFRYLTSRR